MDKCSEKGETELRHTFCDIRDFLDGRLDEYPAWIAGRSDKMVSTVKGLKESDLKHELLVVLEKRLDWYNSQDKKSKIISCTDTYLGI